MALHVPSCIAVQCTTWTNHDQIQCNLENESNNWQTYLPNVFVFFISPLDDMDTVLLKMSAVKGKWKGQNIVN